ncbi:FlgK family flagellar hook-associated protein [Candidatus Paracaedibacter symbiosus]|uniref:FlgK family flagellar hook-associated protein n=1 Tax=Candidatus Paracaedibacter symbiosus TaxID=244582 RepID=UPI0005099B1B|nr:hypothetical protein [Candidatus Paracaedibacter symbiosus]
MTAVSTLVSLLKTERGLSNICSTNIASAEVEGYARKESDIVSLGINGNLSGVTLSQIYNTIDPILQTQTRAQNSLYGMQQATDQLYQKVNLIFGSKGSQTSFVHNFGRFTSSVGEITANPDITKKTQAIADAVAFANQISDVANTVNELRGNADQMLGDAITQINTLLQQISESNQTIFKLSASLTGSPANSGYIDITSFENERDEYIQQLAGLIGIDVYKTDDNKVNIGLAGSGQILVQGIYNYQLDYTAATSVKPGDALSKILYLGTDIKNEIISGQVAGLVNMRDTVLPNAQQEFDEMTRVIRDTVNKLHNQGASLRGSQTLTGTASVPGPGGVAVALTSAPAISGAGTVRIGVINNLGTIIDYKDVDLSTVATVNDILNINTANYMISTTTTPAVGGGFAINQLASGAIQIQASTPGNTIVIGAAGPTLPTLSCGTPYNAAISFGFSHFLGLNNFFVTGNDLVSTAVSPTAKPGIANQLQVRSDIATNPSFFSVGSLDSNVPISVSVDGALPNRATDIANQIVTKLTTGKLAFSGAGAISAINTDAASYATQLMSLLQTDINQSSQNLKMQESIYNQMAALASEKTSVDVSDELIKIYNISTSQQVATKALSITLEMIKSIINII